MENTFGKHLKEIRTTRKITQEQLASEINNRFGSRINKSMISKWENGKELPYMDYVRYIAQYFDVSIDYIMGLEISYNNPNALMQRMQAYWSKYNKCSEAGQEKINKYIDNVFEMEQAEKEVSGKKTTDNHLSSISGGKASSSKYNDYLTPVAAHNDDTSEEQIKLMREDLDEL